jgi:deoxyribonuclease (pyrimidine dimer)
MTRINLVHVKDLADQHLFAEWREIKMIAPAARRSLATQSIATVVEKIPKEYTLNAGHVTFFYNKLPFLKDRFGKLTEELLQRGFDIKTFDFETPDYTSAWLKISQVYWKPTRKDIQVNVDRIVQRLNERPDWYRYYGDVYAPDFFMDRYQQQLLVDTIVA